MAFALSPPFLKSTVVTPPLPKDASAVPSGLYRTAAKSPLAPM